MATFKRRFKQALAVLAGAKVFAPAAVAKIVTVPTVPRSSSLGPEPKMAKLGPNANKRQADSSPPRAVASAHPGAPDHVKRGFAWRKSVVVAIAALAVLAPLVWIVAANVRLPVLGMLGNTVAAVATRLDDWAAATGARARSVMPDRTATLNPPEPEEASRSLVPASRGGRRVALVVGNAVYRHANRLANPRNDARDMTAALADLGFDVVRGLDLEGEAFYRHIDEFEKRTEGARAALFYYAGHGMQLGDANYLLPVDAKPDSERVLKGTAVKLDEVLAGMKSDIRLVFLDACRDNPFLNSIARARGVRSSAMHRGLKHVDRVHDGGMFIAYATEPGDVAADGGGRNSPFTAALKQHIGVPGMEINQVINRVRRTVMAAQPDQKPWHSSSLHDDFFFAPAGPSADAPPAAPRVDPAEEQWKQIKSSTNIAHFERFIRTHSNSPLMAAAQARLEQLRERALVADIQTQLNAMGFRAGIPDGVLGDQTRKAMVAFAHLQRVPALVSVDLLKALKRARNDGLRNFLGCRTERSPRTVHDTERVPSKVSEWAQDSIDVRVRQDNACDPRLGCYNPLLGPGYINYGAQCARQCETVQKGYFPSMKHRILSELENECRSDLKYEDVEDFRDVRVDRVSDIDCRCPPGSMCHCYYKANCAFRALKTYTEYETKTVAKTVYDEREICECLAPEVSGRADCVRPTS